MTKEELKNKCKERAKIFQQAMESCKSSNPIDCIEWFADRISELEKENAELKEKREQECDSSWYEGFNCSEKERLKQLTKATELLKKSQGYIENIDGVLYDEIEQFIGEIEK